MKEYLGKSIHIEQLNPQFFEVRQLRYEKYTSWFVFSKNGNIQEMPTVYQKQEISSTNSGITIFLANNYDGDELKLIYTSDFSKLLTKEEIPK